MGKRYNRFITFWLDCVKLDAMAFKMSLAKIWLKYI